MKNDIQENLILIARRAGIVAAILALGIALFFVLVKTGPTPEKTIVHQDPPRVQVLRVTRRPIGRQWRGFGTARAMDSADVPARVTAVVVHVPDDVEPGRAVAKDQVLVQLDDSDFQRRVEIARGNLAETTSQLEQLEIERGRHEERLALEVENVALVNDELKRIQRLVERGAGNQQDLDSARRAVIAAERNRVITAEALDMLGPRRIQLEALGAGLEASLRLGRQELERCRITSPLDGILHAVDVEVGENIAAGQRVARVVNVDRIEIPLRLPAAALADVAVGDAITLQSTSRADRKWTAKLVRISPEIDPQTRTGTVYAQLDQGSDRGAAKTPGLLWPGTFVQGAVASGHLEARLVVPSRSVVGDQVLVVEDGEVTTRQVHVEFLVEGRIPDQGLPDDQWAVLDDAVRDGELILLNASARFSAGQQVQALVVSEGAYAGPDALGTADSAAAASPRRARTATPVLPRAEATP